MSRIIQVIPARHDRGGRVLQLVRVRNPLSERSEPSVERADADNADNADNDPHTRTNGSPMLWSVPDDADDDGLDPATLADLDAAFGDVPEVSA